MGEAIQINSIQQVRRSSMRHLFIHSSSSHTFMYSFNECPLIFAELPFCIKQGKEALETYWWAEPSHYHLLFFQCSEGDIRWQSCNHQCELQLTNSVRRSMSFTQFHNKVWTSWKCHIYWDLKNEDVSRREKGKKRTSVVEGIWAKAL